MISVETISRESMPKKKKKRSSVERAIEAIIGGLIAYISSSATDVWRFIFLLVGIALILHALLWD